MRLPKEIRDKFVKAGALGDREAKAAGGRKGGKARMAQLTPEQRRDLASRAGKAAALARWRKALKVGDEVRVRGQRGTARVEELTAYMADTTGWSRPTAAVLDRVIDGFACWKIENLVPPAQRGKGSK